MVNDEKKKEIFKNTLRQMTLKKQPFKIYAFLLAKLLQLCPNLCNPMNHSKPGSSVHGILRQEYWSGVPYPPTRDLPNPRTKPTSLLPPALAGRFFTNNATWEAHHIHLYSSISPSPFSWPEIYLMTSLSSSYQHHILHLTQVLTLLVNKWKGTSTVLISISAHL